MESILIVDDEQSIRRLLRRMLEEQGYRCTTAVDVAEARRLMEDEPFDLVLSDIRMPGESGIDFAEDLIQRFPDTAVIMASVIEETDLAERMLSMGIYDFIAKPIDRYRVLVSVSNALQRRRLEVANRRYREQLETLVAQRTAALAEANDKLEETIRVLKETQAQMIHAEKMASIGQLAAGIAHEINNPTGFVTSNLNTLGDYFSDLHGVLADARALAQASLRTGPAASPQEPRHAAARIEARADEIDIDYILSDIPGLIGESLDGLAQIGRIVSDLKSFAHPGEKKRVWTDINGCIASALNIAHNEIKYKATVTQDLAELPQVMGNPQELNQVFLNLLVNAAHAIESSGRIHVTTRMNDGHVEVRVCDTGCGIPEDCRHRIFEPFFTTKEVGKGTGLGLHLVYRIVESHGGRIAVESEVGAGTTFLVSLPMDAAADVPNP